MYEGKSKMNKNVTFLLDGKHARFWCGVSVERNHTFVPSELQCSSWMEKKSFKNSCNMNGSHIPFLKVN